MAVFYLCVALLCVTTQTHSLPFTSPLSPCQQLIPPCPQVVPPCQPVVSQPVVATTIVDNTVSNSLANALQLLIVSNLIENTLNPPCGCGSSCGCGPSCGCGCNSLPTISPCCDSLPFQPAVYSPAIDIFTPDYIPYIPCDPICPCDVIGPYDPFLPIPNIGCGCGYDPYVPNYNCGCDCNGPYVPNCGRNYGCGCDCDPYTPNCCNSCGYDNPFVPNCGPNCGCGSCLASISNILPNIIPSLGCGCSGCGCSGCGCSGIPNCGCNNCGYDGPLGSYCGCDPCGTVIADVFPSMIPAQVSYNYGYGPNMPIAVSIDPWYDPCPNMCGCNKYYY